MPTQTPNSVHHDSILTNVSVNHMLDTNGYIADKVFPRVPVAHKSDYYWVFDQGEHTRDEMQIRKPATESAGTGWTQSKDQYSADVFALHIDVDDQTVANADDPITPFITATEQLTNAELIKRELEWVTNFFTGGIWTTELDGSTSDFVQISDGSSEPIELIAAQQTAVESLTGLWPNTLVVDRFGWNALRNHPDIVARMSGGATTQNPAMVSEVQREIVAGLLGVDNIYVASGIFNAAARTADGTSAKSIQRIAGKDALLVYTEPSAGMRRPTAGMTFVWNQYIGSEEGRSIERFRMQEIKAERVEIEATWDMKVTSADLGVFLENFVA